MKSKSKIERQLQKKTNPELVNTIIAAKKKKEWNEVASILSSSKKNRKNLNLEEIDKEVKEGEHIVVPGKVLSQGEINKKIKISALGFSEKTKEKLKESKINFNLILEEIKSNPNAKEIRILK